MNPRDLIRIKSDLFRYSGIPDPEVDASLLLSYVCSSPPLALRMDTETNLDDETIRRYELLCSRRINREPLQYILCETSFYGYAFQTDPRVLIPRPETELLCEWALETAGYRQRVLDLCCGSGCIGISLKLKRPDLSVFLSDISEEALSVAKSNADHLSADVRFFHGDLFSALPVCRFDLIVSNPPYIPTDTCRSLQPEVMAEPLIALDGGPDGLSFYRRICNQASSFLECGGTLLLEAGDGEAFAVKKLMESSGFTDITIRSDYQSLPRMVGGRIA